MSTCGQILRWRPRYDTVHGDRHDHTCRLEAGHPVNDYSGVQVHTCSQCTLAAPHDGISRDEARRRGHPTRFVRPGT